MNVIRGGDANTVVRSAMILDLGDLKRQGELVKEAARQEAARIIEKAKVEADRLTAAASEKGFAEGKQKGHEAGFEKGLEEGVEKAYQERSPELESLNTTWNTCLHEYLAIREHMLTAARADVVELALKIAERVVYRIVEFDPSVIEDQIAQALRMVARKTDVVLRVNPEDLETAQKLMPSLISTIEGCNHAEVVGDHAIERGGCYVQCGSGAVDATLDTQLARVTEQLLPAAPDGTQAPTDHSTPSDGGVADEVHPADEPSKPDQSEDETN
jgi:flagellar assembly protein FliH